MTARPRRQAVALVTVGLCAALGLASLAVPAVAAPAAEASTSAAPAAIVAALSATAATADADRAPTPGVYAPLSPAAAAATAKGLPSDRIGGLPQAPSAASAVAGRSAGSATSGTLAAGAGWGATMQATPRVQPRVVASTAVQPAPGGSVAPAVVTDGSGGADISSGVTVGGVDYRVRVSSADPLRSYLESRTTAGWSRVTALASSNVLQVAEFEGAVYVATYAPGASCAGTSTIWRLDGADGAGDLDAATFTKNRTVPGILTLVPTTDRLFQFSATCEGIDARSSDGSSFPTTGTNFNKPIASVFALGATLFVEMQGTSTSAIYRVDPEAGQVPNRRPVTMTRLATSPYLWSITQWHGAVYFTGAKYDGSSVGLYRFDGTSAPTKVDFGIPSADIDSLPTLAVLGDDLYVEVRLGDTGSRLFSFDGGTTVDLGAIGDADDSVFGISAAEGRILASTSDGTALLTWLYDPAARIGDPIVTTTPVLTGAVEVGSTISVSTPGWTPTATLSYTWNLDGEPIPGATKGYHTPKASELSHRLDVVVTGTAFGTSTGSDVSITSEVDLGTITLKPVIAGTMRAGTTVIALTRGLAPKAASLTYRWYRDGKPLAGATKSAYRVTSGDTGRRLTVVVHAVSAAYADARFTSPARTALKK